MSKYKLYLGKHEWGKEFSNEVITVYNIKGVNEFFLMIEGVTAIKHNWDNKKRTDRIYVSEYIPQKSIVEQGRDYVIFRDDVRKDFGDMVLEEIN